MARDEPESESAPGKRAAELALSALAGLFIARGGAQSAFSELEVMTQARSEAWRAAEAAAPGQEEYWQAVSSLLGGALAQVAQGGYVGLEPFGPEGLDTVRLTPAAQRVFSAALKSGDWELPDSLDDGVEPAGSSEALPPAPSRLRDEALVRRAGLVPGVLAEEGVLHLVGPVPQDRSQGWWVLAVRERGALRARHAVFAVGSLALAVGRAVEPVLSTERLSDLTKLSAVKNAVAKLNDRLEELGLPVFAYSREAGGYPKRHFPNLQLHAPGGSPVDSSVDSSAPKSS